ncbi:MAG TPA: vWA domain-containing protein [Gaiellaceae bacterium]|nr:vWA domain-containing protein [Gaiellaceae bacterium]HLF68891.1 vWA domain-containing protein [Gaiellaceae bacterium]
MRLWTRSSTGIDSSDARTLGSVVRRTRLVHAVLLVAACSLLAAGVASSRDLETNPGGLLPGDATAVVVLDLSLSIADRDYLDMRRALRRLIADGTPLGLVVFSDVPYEMLPPGSPASELEPLLRLLVPRSHAPPVNPWVQAFRAGTRISTALELARGMLERDEVENGSIILISDLETAPDDVPPLASTVEDLDRAGVRLRVVGLAPSSESQVIFRGLLGDDAFLPGTGAEPSTPKPRTAGEVVPLGLVVLGGLFFLALATHERFTARLGLPRLPRHRGGEA